MKSDDGAGPELTPKEPAAQAEPPGDGEAIDGLAELFEQARLKPFLPAAEAKLQEWGAVDVEEILDDADLLKQLEDHLQLKKLERSRLENAIRARPAPPAAPYLSGAAAACAVNGLPPSSTEGSGGGTPLAAETGPMARANVPVNFHCTPMTVKNTFVDIADDPDWAPPAIPRSTTSPPDFKRRLETTVEGEDQEHDPPAPPAPLQHLKTRDCFEDVDYGSGPSPLQHLRTRDNFDDTAGCPMPGGLHRLKTRDGFEDVVGSPTGGAPPHRHPRTHADFEEEVPHPPLPPGMPQAALMWGWPPAWPPSMMPNWGEYGPTPMGMMPPPDGSSVFAPWCSASGDPSLWPPVPDGGSTGADEVQKRPPSLQTTFSPDSGCMHVFWTVPAKKLSSKDTHPYVSPTFMLSFGSATVPFKMMITPKVANDAKGGASFKKAKGKGYVELVCEATPPEASSEVQFRIGIGKEVEQSRGDTRGTVSHDFHQQKVGRLPKELAEWNFETAVDSVSQSFVVCLEILKSSDATN